MNVAKIRYYNHLFRLVKRGAVVMACRSAWALARICNAYGKITSLYFYEGPMGKRDTYEPPYPQTRDELDRYCARLIDALVDTLGDDLVCVLLCGSWARGEAHPPTSDVDITVIVNHIDAPTLHKLQRAWRIAEMGSANIYTRAEAATMSHVALEMYTTNAQVLWGDNPFPLPTRADFCEDIVQNAESVARYARHLIVCYWQTPEEHQSKFAYLLDDIQRLMQNMVAFRTGTFPKNRKHFEAIIAGTSDSALLNWLRSLDEAEMLAQRVAIAEKVNSYVNACIAEVAPFRKALLAVVTQQTNMPAG